MNLQILFFRIACILGALAVVLGAFGAHGLKERLSAEMLDVWEVGVRYHMYHALALLAVSLFSTIWASPWTGRACWFWLAGILIFSGSLYLLTLTGIKMFGAITPIGGVALIVGWALLLFSAKNLLG